MNYRAYGLNIHSELPLPEFIPLPEKQQDNIDVHICYGQIPETLTKQPYYRKNWEAAHGEFIFRLYNIANYYVEKGRKIIIERFPQSTDNDVRTFLLGTPLSALLHQRGLLVMHAGAIQTGSGAVLFTGKSGSGKSTLITALQQRGYAMLSDDISAIVTSKGQVPKVLPSLAQVKLWPDMAAELDVHSTKLKRMRNGLEKLLLPIENYCHQPLPVNYVYILAIHNQPEVKIEAVKNIDKFSQLFNNTYRKRVLHAMGLQAQHFNQICNLVSTVKIFRITRPNKRMTADEMISLIEKSWH